MKTSLQAALAVASVTLLAACASSGGIAQAPPQSQQSHGTTTTDTEYMAMVERVARRRGVTVRWFNPPPKGEVAVADAGSDAQ